MESWTALLLSLLLTHATNAQIPTTCPLLGPQWPSPSNIASASTFQTFADTLRSTLDREAYNTTTSFSIGIFSASEPDLLWQYHHSTVLLANGTQGTRQVDADSIYRIGSISKLLTVFTFLIAEGDGKWSDPVIKHLPELDLWAGDVRHVTPDWAEITLGDLAGHMAGLGRDCERCCSLLECDIDADR